MANYNKIILVGNLTRDPQLKYLPSQMAVTEFGLAVNNKYRTKSGEDREEVCFVDCSIFGKGAEIINQYCQKGKQILVEGRLKYDSWEDKQGGGKRHKHSVLVENFQFLGGREGGAGGGGNYGGGDAQEDQRPPQRAASAQRPPARAPNKPAPEQPFGEEQQFNEDDIPF
jgi:single-strand DNA-binding protein